MKKINVNDFEKRNGEILHCVEMTTNDSEERSVEIYEFKTKKEAEEKAEELNRTNNDKRFKYFAIDYLVENDSLTVY